MSIILISCLDMASGIGDEEGNLLFDIPKDMEHFKATTSGKSVVMGRKTYESIGEPLKNRKNYVLSENEDFNPQGVTVVRSIEEVLELSKSRDIFVIGGGEIYSHFMPYADKMILTHVHEFNFDARTFFPDFSPKDWSVGTPIKHEKDKNNKHPFSFATYTRRENK